MVNLFSGHLECSSPTHAKILILKSFLSRTQMSKENQQNSRFSSNWISLKLFDGHAKRQFWQLCWNDFAKIWIFLTQSEKLIKKYMFFEKYFFSPKIVLDTKNAILIFQLISLLLLSKFFSSESPKSWRELYTVQESAFFQKNCLTQEMQLWQLYRNFRQTLLFSPAKVRKKWIEHFHFSANWFFLEVFHWHKECSSDNPPDEVLLKSFFSAENSKKMNQNVVLSAKNFSSKFFLDSKNAVLTTRLVKLSQTQVFFPKVRKRSKILWVLRKTCFSSNVPQDTVNALWTLLPLSLLLRWKLPSARSPKRWTNLYIFQQNCFSSKHSLDKRITVMTTFANNSRKFVFFSAQSPEKRKKIYIF